MPQLSHLNGVQIVDFDINTGITDPTIAPRLRQGTYNMGPDDPTILEQIRALGEDPMVGELTHLSIGYWGYEYGERDTDPFEVKAELLKIAPKLTNLDELFWGDISYDECEVSWFYNTDVGPIVKAFPQLRYFGARGGNDLRFSNLEHEHLEHLEIQTGGMSQALIEDIAQATLPNLRRLEMWLGDSGYGFTGSLDDLKPFLHGRGELPMQYPFPKLEHLGLMNSELADGIAAELNGAPVLDQIKVLDLSMGTMTSRGLQVLLDNPAIEQLERLDLSNNGIGDEALLARAEALPLTVSTGQRENFDEEEWSYTQVGE